LAAGPTATGSGELYEKEAGLETQRLMRDLQAEAGAGGRMTARDYADFFAGLIADREVREPIYPHPDILIWGTQEARVQGADLVILSGLNEGTWPATPPADPWLNRTMRAEVGLRLPDRSVGLAAHDFQQGMAAPQVWLTRATRDAETDTVASRWINRLTNLLQGSGGEARAALSDMRRRGETYLTWSRALMAPHSVLPPEPRPAPVPPAKARPTLLSVTEFETLIRDPYAVYAKRVLKLRKLDGLRAEPDPRLRGTAMHTVMERFVAQTRDGLPDQARAEALLLQIVDEVLAQEAPWPVTQRLWRARFAKIVRPFLLGELKRRDIGVPTLLEAGRPMGGARNGCHAERQSGSV
jgi:ATP-dependent helicase/nuclease subunit B